MNLSSYKYVKLGTLVDRIRDTSLNYNHYTQAVLDSLRTMTVWAFSLSVRALDPHSGHGQKFSALELGGFAMMMLGTRT